MLCTRQNPSFVAHGGGAPADYWYYPEASRPDVEVTPAGAGPNAGMAP